MRRANTKVQLWNTKVNCVTASGQSLEILGEIKVPLKVQGFSWLWTFLASRNLTGHPILGADFITKTRIVLELVNTRCYFDFAPRVRIPFCGGARYSSCASTRSLSQSLPQIQMGHLSASQRNKLENLVKEYPDVLNERLGLTNLIEYDIQLLENTPVRLPPYRLLPPKMLYLRGHI
jgi:hypothetical protein